MNPYILMCKRTGKLLEGFRVCFLDKELSRPILDKAYSIAILECDGWILRNPEVGIIFWFFNKAGTEENFINLGEL